MKNKAIVVILLYFILNLINPYFITLNIFNNHVTNFSNTFLDHLFSILGNFAVLVILLGIGLIFIRRKKGIVIYLVILTFLLNLLIFLLWYFTRSFKVFPVLANISLFANPNAGFAKEIILDGLIELSSIRILTFLPFIVLLILSFFIKGSDKKDRPYKGMICLLSGLLLSFSVFLYSNNSLKEWPFQSERAHHVISSGGIYNYYLTECFYNRWSEEYLLEETENENSRILEGYNLFIIQAEALSNFNLTLEIDSTLLMPKLNEFIKNESVFYFPKAYSTIGVGNTSDAEFSVNTGYYPLGDLTINWEVYDKEINIQSIAKLFDSYDTRAYNPTIEGFYAHKQIFEMFYGFSSFKGLESYKTLYPYEKYLKNYYHDMWVSDKSMLDLSLIEAKDSLDKGNNFYTFISTIAPHYPFTSLGYESEIVNTLDKRFNNYLSQIIALDTLLSDFLINASTILPNTLFVIYGDHGNTLSKRSYEILFNESISDFSWIEYQANIPLIFYDPSNLLTSSIVVDTNKVVSQVDIFSTIVSLFNLDATHNIGIDVFSSNKSFYLDPKNFLVITDDFTYNFKNNLASDECDFLFIDKIKRLKLANDSYINGLIYD